MLQWSFVANRARRNGLVGICTQGPHIAKPREKAIEMIVGTIGGVLLKCPHMVLGDVYAPSFPKR